MAEQPKVTLEDAIREIAELEGYEGRPLIQLKERARDGTQVFLMRWPGAGETYRGRFSADRSTYYHLTKEK